MGISAKEALDCFRSDDLVGIGMEADAVRRRLHPEGVVSYVVGRRVTWGPAMDAGSREGVYAAIGESMEMGGSVVSLRGGVSGCDGLEGWEGLLRGVRQRFRELWIEGVRASEAMALAAECGIGVPETLARLQDAGLDAIASDGVDLREGNGRGSVSEWAEVHRAAHGLGMRTTAEMVFGAGETMEQRVDFLELVRVLQEETGGFAAFVPVSADAPNGRELDGVTAVERLKTLAIGRMFLDGIENVQASRAGQGLKVLQMGLRFGANDVGAVSGEGASEEDVRRVIRDAGFRPAERDAAYRAMMLV